MHFNAQILIQFSIDFIRVEYSRFIWFVVCICGMSLIMIENVPLQKKRFEFAQKYQIIQSQTQVENLRGTFVFLSNARMKGGRNRRERMLVCIDKLNAWIEISYCALNTQKKNTPLHAQHCGKWCCSFWRTKIRTFCSVVVLEYVSHMLLKY